MRLVQDAIDSYEPPAGYRVVSCEVDQRSVWENEVFGTPIRVGFVLQPLFTDARGMEGA